MCWSVKEMTPGDLNLLKLVLKLYVLFFFFKAFNLE